MTIRYETMDDGMHIHNSGSFVLYSDYLLEQKRIESIKKDVNKAIKLLASPKMEWDQAMRILFKIVGREYQF